MFEISYLENQNKTLMRLSVAISTSAIIHAGVLVGYGHFIMALFEMCITVALCSGIYTIICKNKRISKKWKAITSIDHSAFTGNISGVAELKNNIGNLNFKFTRPSE